MMLFMSGLAQLLISYKKGLMRLLLTKKKTPANIGACKACLHSQKFGEYSGQSWYTPIYTFKFQAIQTNLNSEKKNNAVRHKANNSNNFSAWTVKCQEKLVRQHKLVVPTCGKAIFPLLNNGCLLKRSMLSLPILRLKLISFGMRESKSHLPKSRPPLYTYWTI